MSRVLTILVLAIGLAWFISGYDDWFGDSGIDRIARTPVGHGHPPAPAKVEPETAEDYDIDADLTAEIRLDRRALYIRNDDAVTWSGIRVSVTSGMFGSYNILINEPLPPGDEIVVPLDDLTGGGKRFDPDHQSVEQVVVSADRPDGRRGIIGGRFD